jgi:hypothetical protein
MQDGRSAAAVAYLLASVALGLMAVLVTRRVLGRVLA